MLKELIFVGLGGFLGSAGRYLLSLLWRTAAGGFPVATLAANLLGCLLLGLLSGWIARTPQFNTPLALFLTVGFCGGFTTFSTFSKEGFALLQSGQYGLFAAYFLVSLAGGLLLFGLGYWLTR